MAGLLGSKLNMMPMMGTSFSSFIDPNAQMLSPLNFVDLNMVKVPGDGATPSIPPSVPDPKTPGDPDLGGKLPRRGSNGILDIILGLADPPWFPPGYQQGPATFPWVNPRPDPNPVFIPPSAGFRVRGDG